MPPPGNPGPGPRVSMETDSGPLWAGYTQPGGWDGAMAGLGVASGSRMGR